MWNNGAISAKSMDRIIRIPQNAQPAMMMIQLPAEESSIRVHVEENAMLHLLCLQKENGTHAKIVQDCTVESGAMLHLWNISLGGTIHDLTSRVTGPDGTSTIDWIFYGSMRERQELSARNIFDAPRGRGQITVHGVAEDHAQVSFDGCIEITKNGGGTDTYLTEKTLMLDPTAKVNAVPGLEIKTNDVKASHSASISKVSDEDLFYFASRGIALNTARRMYVEGFLGALLEKIPDEKIRQSILFEIAKKYKNDKNALS